MEDAAQGVGLLGGVQVFGEIGAGGEEPVLAQEMPGAARGFRLREGGEQGQQQELDERRNLGVQNRPRPGARCVGFAQCGVLVRHWREYAPMQHRRKGKKLRT